MFSGRLSLHIAPLSIVLSKKIELAAAPHLAISLVFHPPSTATHPPTPTKKQTNKQIKQMGFLWFFFKLPNIILLTNSGISTKNKTEKTTVSVRLQLTWIKQCSLAE